MADIVRSGVGQPKNLTQPAQQYKKGDIVIIDNGRKYEVLKVLDTKTSWKYELRKLKASVQNKADQNNIDKTVDQDDIEGLHQAASAVKP